MKTTYDIKPADGKLGILIPGIGAVATTFIAGVFAVRKNLGKPIGIEGAVTTMPCKARIDAPGLLRSICGWEELKRQRKSGERINGDERILGDRTLCCYAGVRACRRNTDKN